jgi:hypothetical protein
VTEPGALPPDRLPAEHRVRPRWLRLLIGRRPGTPSTSPWEPWVHAVGFALVFTVAGAVLSASSRGGADSPAGAR